MAGEPAADEINRFIPVACPDPFVSSVGIATTTGDFVPDGDVIAFATSCSSQFSMIVPSGISVRDGSNNAYVVCDGYSGEPGSEHVASVRVGFAEPDVVVSGPLQPEVESPDPAEQGEDIHAARPAGTGSSVSETIVDGPPSERVTSIVWLKLSRKLSSCEMSSTLRNP